MASLPIGEERECVLKFEYTGLYYIGTLSLLCPVMSVVLGAYKYCVYVKAFFTCLNEIPVS